MIRYPVLAEECKRRRIKKRQLATTLGVDYKTFYNKWHGLTAFTWPEVCKIRQTYFPDMTSDELFSDGFDKK